MVSLVSGGAVPVVDLKVLKTPQELADAVRKSLSTVGFLFVANHGLEDFANEIFELSEKFFSEETDAEKERCAYANNKGYVKVHQEALDPKAYPEGDFKENFNIGIISPGPPPKPGHPLPAILAAKADRIAAFQQECQKICRLLLEAFALALGIEGDYFTKQHFHNDNFSLLRILHYPAAAGGAKLSPNRAGAHSDYGSLTLLFQRSAGGEGLQILPSTESLETGIWRDVGVVEGAMLVNVGDAMEYWTGAQLKSTLHRVRLPDVIPPEGIPDRYSMAFFCQPDPEAKIKSVLPASAISDYDLERMARKGVKPGGEIVASAHLKARLDATYRFTA